MTIAIYAGILATINFVWRIYEFFYDRRSRIKIELGILTNVDNYFCLVIITNLSKQKKFIEQPDFVADKVYDKEGSMFGFGGNLSFPLGISSEEKVEFQFLYSNLEKKKKELNIKKIKAVVKDSTGKIYKSEWMEI